MEFIKRKSRITHSTTYEVSENGTKTKERVFYKSGTADITVEVTTRTMVKDNLAAKKLFILAMIKVNEQALYSGNLKQNYVSFSLEDLVDMGMYNSTRSARRGFMRGATALTEMQMNGCTSYGNKKNCLASTLAVLFTKAYIKNNRCTIVLNDKIKWGFIVQYFTLLPKYCFALTKYSFALLYYIFYLARQNTRKIENQGYFNISFRAIQAMLRLPDETTSHDNRRDIKNTLQAATTEIEEKHEASYGNQNLRLKHVCDERADISTYLETGYLKVIFKNDLAEMYIKISRATRQKIDRAKKKRDCWAIMAHIKNLADTQAAKESLEA